MRYEFRDFSITRTCDKKYKDYHNYKPNLMKDFHGRCAYCNLHKDMITSYFEVDHYIPRDEFEEKWPELDTDYNNLMLACRKCNSAKGSEFKGDLSKRIIDNGLFYDPTKVDYNKIFYRDESCGISSDDEKGMSMISLLKLYYPIHNLAFFCEITHLLVAKLERRMSMIDSESEEYALIRELKMELKGLYSDCRDLFIANYNNSDFKLDE